MSNPKVLNNVIDILIDNDYRFIAAIKGSLDTVETVEEINEAIKSIKTWPRKSIESVKNNYTNILQRNVNKFISLLSNDEQRNAFFEVTSDMLVDRIKEKQRKQLEDYQKLLDQKTFEYAYSLKLNENQNNPNKTSQSESISSFVDKEVIKFDGEEVDVKKTTFLKVDEENNRVQEVEQEIDDFAGSSVIYDIYKKNRRNAINEYNNKKNVFINDMIKNNKLSKEQAKMAAEKMLGYIKNGNVSNYTNDYDITGDFKFKEAQNRAINEILEAERNFYKIEEESNKTKDISDVSIEEENKIKSSGKKYSVEDYLGKSLEQESNEFFNNNIKNLVSKNSIGNIAKEYLNSNPSEDTRILLNDVINYSANTVSYADFYIGKKEEYFDTNAFGKLYKENNISKKIIKNAKTLYADLMKQYENASINEEPVLVNGHYVESEATRKIGDELKMVSGILMHFESLKNGNLVAPKEEIIDYSKTLIENNDGSKKNILLDKDAPIFPHEPVPDDIVQGGLGDCFFMSALASMAKTNPQLIKDSICDNGDGTCTVRFFNRIAGENGPGADDTFEPVYIKVSKEVPSDAGARDSAPWVAIMERAYAASGLQIKEKSNVIKPYAKYNKAQDFNKLYNELKLKDKSKWPSHIECPQLIDENGNLHNYKPSYNNIRGGSTEFALQFLGGADYKDSTIKFKSDRLIEECAIDLFSDMYKKSGVKFSKEMHDNYINDKENLSTSDLGYMLYATKFKSTPPLNKNGEPDFNDDGVFATYLMAKHFTQSLKKVFNDKSKSFNNKNDFAKAINDEFTKNLVDSIKDKETSISFFYKKQKDLYDSCYSTLYNNVKTFFNNEKTDYRPKEKNSGEYNAVQNRLFDKISKCLNDQNSNNITFNTETDGILTDSDTNKGIHYCHAYTVEGVTTRNIGGKDYKFLIVRNPHGSDLGRTYEYDKNNNKVVPVETNTKNGLSYVELSDIEGLADIGINKKHVYEPSNLSAKFDTKTISNYLRIIEPFEKELNKIKSNNKIDSLNNLKTAVSDFKEKITNGFGSFIFDTEKWVNDLQNKSKVYKDYLKNLNKNNDFNVKKQINVAEGLEKLSNDIINSCKNKIIVKNPMDQLKIDLAKQLIIEKNIERINQHKPKLSKENILKLISDVKNGKYEKLNREDYFSIFSKFSDTKNNNIKKAEIINNKKANEIINSKENIEQMFKM